METLGIGLEMIRILVKMLLKMLLKMLERCLKKMWRVLRTISENITVKL